MSTGPAGLRRVGHKGADAVETGNTIASFERAVEIGVEMIEFDVLWTEQGSPKLPASRRTPLVVAHDWADARLRDPHTLDEALDAFTRPPLKDVEIDCDLKLPGREYDLVSALREHGLIERAMVSTMHVESLATIAALEPGLRRGWTYPKVTRPWDRRRWARPAVAAAVAAMRRRLPQLLERTHADLELATNWVHHTLVGRRLVEVASRHRIEVIAWTVDDPARIAELRELGVDGICSNDPRLLSG